MQVQIGPQRHCIQGREVRAMDKDVRLALVRNARVLHWYRMLVSSCLALIRNACALLLCSQRNR